MPRVLAEIAAALARHGAASERRAHLGVGPGLAATEGLEILRVVVVLDDEGAAPGGFAVLVVVHGALAEGTEVLRVVVLALVLVQRNVHGVAVRRVDVSFAVRRAKIALAV